jgi:hypothetical protein
MAYWNMFCIHIVQLIAVKNLISITSTCPGIRIRIRICPKHVFESSQFSWLCYDLSFFWCYAHHRSCGLTHLAPQSSCRILAVFPKLDTFYSLFWYRNFCKKACAIWWSEDEFTHFRKKKILIGPTFFYFLSTLFHFFVF